MFSDINFFKLRDEKIFKILYGLVIFTENGGDQSLMMTRYPETSEHRVGRAKVDRRRAGRLHWSN